MARPATGSSIGRPLRGATAITLALLLLLTNVRPASAAGPTDGFVTDGGTAFDGLSAGATTVSIPAPTVGRVRYTNDGPTPRQVARVQA